PDARPDGGGARRLRRDGPGPHRPARGQVGQVGARRSPGRPDLAVPVAAPPAARLSGSDPVARWRADGHDRAARILAATLVAARPAQPDGSAGQGRAALPEEYR